MIFSLIETKKITFKTLANHTSGMPRMASNFEFDISHPDPFASYTEKKLLDYLANELELKQNQASKYVYSNVGAGFLGYTLSKIKEKSLINLFQENIFSKYNMTNSTIGSKNVTTHLVQGLNADGQQTSNWNFGPISGAGAIISTAEDISKFAIAQLQESDSILNLTRTETHNMSEKTSIGLGWHIKSKTPNEKWFWHNGGTGGYTSCMVVNTVNKNGVIILSNVSALGESMDNIDKLCFAIMDKL